MEQRRPAKLLWTSQQFALFLTLCVVASSLVVKSVEGLECEYYNLTECGVKSKGFFEEGDEDRDCKESQKTVSCPVDGTSSQTVACFVLWQRSKNSTREVIQFKGCFYNNKQCVNQTSCVDRGPPKTPGERNKNATALTHFCCCDSNGCNGDHEWNPDPTTTTPKPQPVVVAPDYTLHFVAGVTFFMVIVFFLVTWLTRQRYNKKQLPLSQSQLSDEENILLDKSESTQTLAVTLVEIKASGRFGHVWKASMQGHNNCVAVKILPLREKTSWKLEQEVYSLPLLCESEFILGFYGARTHFDNDNVQLWLISEYIERGSLYDYLKGHVLTWTELLHVAVTMCQGLAFLHEEIDYGVKGIKPAVAHRDFKSKNVLLRPDLTACVADFGLAHIFYPTKPVGTNHGQVGTRRYMAPEVLDGAVSFTRDNFQRIDMYACGLVLWELASRCCAQQGPVSEYRLPLEEHVGQQPTLEEMMEAVVTNRKRPTIRNDWISHSGMVVLAEAMKDAWDHDAEARISASCIVERLTSINNKIM